MSEETILTDYKQTEAAKLAQELMTGKKEAYLYLTDAHLQDFEFPPSSPGDCCDFTHACPGRFRVLDPAPLAAALQKTARTGKDYRVMPGYLLDKAGRAFIVVMDTWLEDEHRPMEDEFGQEITDENGNIPRMNFSLVDFSFVKSNPIARAPRSGEALVERFYKECPGAAGIEHFEQWLTSLEGGGCIEENDQIFYTWKTKDKPKRVRKKTVQNALARKRKTA